MDYNGKKDGDDILEYIQNQLSQKKTREEVTATLKGMGWTDDEVNRRFFEINLEKRKRRKKIIINSIAAVFVVIAVVFILLFAPKSPFKYKIMKTATISPQDVVSEDINKTIADIPEGMTKEEIGRIAEQNRKEEAERTAFIAEQQQENSTSPEEMPT